jgi:uncharacterized protein with HEPN domain
MKDDLILLEFMLRAIQEIEEFTAGGANDHKTLMAVRKEIEIIGEAANKISDKIKQQYPTLPWRKMIATRHKLSHEYFGVDAKTIWNVVEKELPTLKGQIQAIVQTLQGRQE